MTFVSDDFNRLDDPTGLGSDWVTRHGSFAIASNMARPVGATSWAQATRTEVMTTDDMEVSVTLGPAHPSIDHFMLYVGANATGECIFAYFYQGNLYWWYQSVWSSYSLQQGPNFFPHTVGDTVTLKRVGTSYTILKNGADTGLSGTTFPSTLIPIDTDHRLLGFGLYSDDGSSFRTIDSFSANDAATSATADLTGTGTLSASVTAVAPPSQLAVVIDHTKVAADLTDFPVYVNLADLPDSFWAAVGDGSGIRCHLGDQELAREVVGLNTSAKSGELHVKADLSSAADTIIAIDPNGGAAYAPTDPYGSAAVWSNSYRSVYHLTGNPAVSLPDSVGGYDLTPVGSGASETSGVMGTALALDGATTMSAATAATVAGGAARTMSAWVLATASVSAPLAIWVQGVDGPGALWEMMRYSGNLILHAYGGGFDTLSVSAPIPDNTLVYCVLTYDGTYVKVYTDGVYRGQVGMGLSTGVGNSKVGGPGYFPRWAGTIDEARLSTVERSAAWIATEYTNQTDPAFYSVTTPPAGVEADAALSSDGTLSATVTARVLQNATLSGVGSLSATAAPVAPPSGFAPTDLSGCTVWLDASQLGLATDASLGATWPDLSGGGHHGAVVGTPAPVVKANAPNGKPVVRFAVNEGRIRGDGMISSYGSDLTVIYVGRTWGANVGRIFTNAYPPYNVLIGTHISGNDSCYDNGWVNSGMSWTSPYDQWRTWGFTFTTSPSNLSAFYINGVASGTYGGTSGHDTLWNLSGYDPTGAQETCDCEVAELVIYDRKLTDAERVQVQDYLYTKWYEEAAPPTEECDATLAGSGSLSATVHKWESPADTPGLGLWLDASAITGAVNADVLPTWSDASPAARHATAIETPPRYRPTGLNGRPAVDFAPGNRRMNIPGWGTALTGKTEYTMFYVAQVASFGYSVIATAPVDTVWRWLIEYNTDGSFYWGHGNAYYRQYLAGLTTGTPHTLTFYHVAGVPHFYVNGTEVTSYYVGPGDTQATVPNVDGDVLLGGYYEGSYPVDGVIAELIWYDRALTTAERSQVQGYLDEKYFGVTPPTSTPVAADFTGSGALAATVASGYPAAAALSGTGTLSATVTARVLQNATLSATGALSAALTKKGSAAAALTSTGTLSATVVKRASAAATFTSTGQLDATVTDAAEDLPPDYGGWTTAPVVPVRRTGPSWNTTVTTPVRQTGSGWFALVEKVGRLTSTGALLATVGTNYPAITVAATGTGTLSATLAPRKAIAAAFTTQGGLTAALTVTRAVTVAFSASGDMFGTSLNEGLSASISGGVAAVDGLSATVAPLASAIMSVTFLSTGTLVVPATQRFSVAPALTATGALATTITPIYTSVAAAFTATGALTATGAPVYAVAASLSSTGTLTPTTTQQFSAASAFTGTGALAATVTPIYSVAAALTTTGTLTTTVTLTYAVPTVLSGTGTLVAAAFALSGGAAALAATGTLTATDSQLYAVVAALSSTGTLTATDSQVYAVAATLSSTGTLTATAVQRFASAPALAATGTLTAAIAATIAAALTSTGTLTATMVQRHASSAALAATGTLSATVLARYAWPRYAVVAGDFETDSAWNPGLTVGTQTTEQAHSGVKSHKLIGTADYVQFVFTNDGAGGYIFPPSAPGRRIFTSVWLRRHTANTNAGTVYLRILPRNAAAQAIAVNQVSILAAAVPNTGWTQISVSAVMPAATVDFYVDVLLGPDVPVGDVFYVDDVAVDDGTGLGAYGTGTLSATGIQQQQITAGFGD